MNTKVLIEPCRESPISTAGMNPSERSEIDRREIDPTAGHEWDRLVATHPQATVFHTSAWAKVLIQTYQHRPAYLCLSRANRLIALLPFMTVQSPFTGRRGVSLPFCDLCPPLFFDESDVRVVLDSVKHLGRERNWKWFELRGGPAPESDAFASTRYFAHKLDLGLPERELLQRCASPVRRALRKAERSDLMIEVAQNGPAMVEFYRLHCRTRRRHGIPPQPWAFFAQIQARLIQRGHGCIVVARRRNKAVAGAVFLRFEKTAIYKFAASDPAALEFRPNNLVIWEGIKSLARMGVKNLHFGRTGPENQGLRRFKLSWGAQEEPINYFRFDLGTEKWMVDRRKTSGFHNQIFQALPVVANRLAGTLIYPHLD